MFRGGERVESRKRQTVRVTLSTRIDKEDKEVDLNESD